MNTKTEIVIVGAGLTGLTLAWYLKKAGKKVIIVEKKERPGGVIQTESENGFVFESGPNTGVLSTPEIADLFVDLAGACTLETANPKSKKRYVLKHGRWHALPSGPLSAVSTPLFTLQDKIRILGEPMRPRGDDPDETVAQMVVRRLGRSFLNYAVDPFISGIYAGDPARLVTRYALPKLYNLEQNYGSFIKGGIKKAKEPKTESEKRATREVFSVKGGLGNLIKALVDGTGTENILMCAQGTSIHPSSNGFIISFINSSGEGTKVEASKVVTTVDSHSIPSLLPFLTDDALKPFAELQYASIVQAALGYTVWKGFKPDAFGGLIPSGEKRNILGILFPSAIFQGRAPEKGALFSVFMGGMRRPDIYKMNDREITGIVLQEAGELLESQQAPDLLKIFRYKYAIPQYEITSGERFAAIRKIEAQYPGLILAGNIRDGIGMADRVKQARQIANLLLQGK